MNKYHLKKMFITLGLSGTMVLAVGCSKKDHPQQPLPSKAIEKDLEDFNITPRPTEKKEDESSNQKITKNETVDSSSKVEKNSDKKKEKERNKKSKKKSLISRIEDADFDPLIEDIFKTIVKKSNEDESYAIHEIRCACDGGSTKRSFMCSAIVEATREQKKGNNYQLENLKIFNNLDKKQKHLPKQILLMEHCSTYGKYKFYEMIESVFSMNSFLFLVTDQQDHVLLVMDIEKVRKVKNTNLQDFSKLLKAYGIESKKKYTYRKLCKDITFRLSKKINDNKNKDSKRIATKDTVVVDTEKLETKENTDKRYYFLKYRYPYLFSSKTDVYSDVFNPNANVTIDQDNTLCYIDHHQNISMFDSVGIGDIDDIDDISPAFQPLNEFLSQKKIPHKKYISYEDLSKINKKVNKSDKKVKKKKIDK